MNLFVTVLGSGSAGNATLVEGPGARLLIDGGLSARQIATRLETLGVAVESLDAILLTHEHGDHIAGLRVLRKKTQAPLYCTRLVAETLQHNKAVGPGEIRQFQPGGEFEIGGIGVQTFSVPHDAVDPVGYLFHGGAAALAYLTDLGKCTHLARERMKSARTIVIETNHDEKMLIDCPRRPWHLKQRILSAHGHLSNTAAATELAGLLEHRLRRAILSHISRECNTPELALETVRAALRQAGASGTGESVELHCASQTEVSPRFEV